MLTRQLPGVPESHHLFVAEHCFPVVTSSVFWSQHLFEFATMPSEPLPSPWQHCFVRGASAESSTRPFASTTGIWLVRRSSGWRSDGKSVGAAGAGGASGAGGGSGAVARASSLSMSYRHIPPTQ